MEKKNIRDNPPKSSFVLWCFVLNIVIQANVIKRIVDKGTEQQTPTT